MKPDKPLQIGITGGIGTGKTLVSKIFYALNVPVYDADYRAKWVMQHNPLLKKEIMGAFSMQAYTNTGELNRAYLASQVFSDTNKMALLNSLVHPKVAEDYAIWVQANARQPYVLKEAALLFESGSYQFIDKIITVFTSMQVRVQRIQKRDPQRTIEEIQGIINKQLPEEEKLQRADFVLYNDDRQLLIPQILKLHHQFLSMASVHHISR